MRLIDRFIGEPDFSDEHHIDIHAPADLVLAVATKMDIQALPIVRSLIWIRGKVMGVRATPRKATALLGELKSLGWRVLAHVPGRVYVLGVLARPWIADAGFHGVDAEDYVACCEPDAVKIVASLDAQPIAPTWTRFTTETYVKATDAEALRKFRRYWFVAAYGIVLIRLVILRALKRRAEWEFGEQQRARGAAAEGREPTRLAL
jgi:hypothetical protein